MLELLRDNQFIVGGLTGSVAALLLSLLHGYIKRERKLLSYSVTSRHVAEKGSGDLEVKYRGQSIRRLDSHSLSFVNSGNKPLLNVPLTIDFGDDAQAVDVEIKGPKGARLSAVAERSEVSANVDLLNCGETVTIGLNVINGHMDRISVAARGENLKLIPSDAEKAAAAARSNEIRQLFLAVLFLLAFVGIMKSVEDFRARANAAAPSEVVNPTSASKK